MPEMVERNIAKKNFGTRLSALPGWLIQRALLALITVYRYAVSPFLGQRCRFHPSCSAYAVEAIQRHGAFKGGWLALRRIGRCHPWGKSGYDPVP